MSVLLVGQRHVPRSIGVCHMWCLLGGLHGWSFACVQEFHCGALIDACMLWDIWRAMGFFWQFWRADRVYVWDFTWVNRLMHEIDVLFWRQKLLYGSRVWEISAILQWMPNLKRFDWARFCSTKCRTQRPIIFLFVCIQGLIQTASRSRDSFGTWHCFDVSAWFYVGGGGWHLWTFWYLFAPLPHCLSVGGPHSLWGLAVFCFQSTGLRLLVVTCAAATSAFPTPRIPRSVCRRIEHCCLVLLDEKHMNETQFFFNVIPLISLML